MDEDLIGGIVFLALLLFIILSIAISVLINSKWNIEKELQLKEMELKYNQNIVMEDK